MSTLDQTTSQEGDIAKREAMAILSKDALGRRVADQLSVRSEQMRGKLQRLLAAGSIPEIPRVDITSLVEAVEDPDVFKMTWFDGFQRHVRGKVEEAVNEALRQLNGGSVLDAHNANYWHRP